MSEVRGEGVVLLQLGLLTAHPRALSRLHRSRTRARSVCVCTRVRVRACLIRPLTTRMHTHTHTGGARAHDTRGTSGEFVAADGEPTSSGARCVVSGVATESRGQGQDAVEWGCASRCDHDPCIARRPPGHRRVDGFKKPRFAGRSPGSADVISFVSNLLAQGAAKLAARRASALALQSMEAQTSLGSRMGALIDESDAKRRCVEGGGH